jgi:hypothetical protein
MQRSGMQDIPGFPPASRGVHPGYGFSIEAQKRPEYKRDAPRALTPINKIQPFVSADLLQVGRP